ncbi:RNA polymerase sigma factor [Amycolatopsis sp. lyj-90]|uniref:RNA polymerase sigma factor n=1 Tax=Amycolatopsis sp. lyj-90 TaxID=2789285 RepID=UPI003978C614
MTEYSERFEDFYADTARRTRDIANSLAGDREIGGDAAQDAYLVMFERWHERKARPPGDNRRYVVGIAAKKVADWYRRNNRFVPLGDENEFSGPGDFPEQVLDRLTLYKEVTLLLENQPARRRMIGILYFLAEFSGPEIAEYLEISTSTVRTQVERLRVRLRPLAHRHERLDGGGERA